MSSQTVIECPICMDNIDFNNKVTTECGHCFHTSCLMRNIAHNGFGCPYCRTTLAEVPKEEEEDAWSDYDDGEELYDDFALNSMRWLFMRVNNEEIPEDDQEEVVEEVEEEIIVYPRPSVELVTQKLIAQGVTMEQLVKMMLAFEHEEYSDLQDECDRLESTVFGKCRIVISNYRPEQERQLVTPSVPAITTNVDTAAQPKIPRGSNNVTVRNRTVA